MSARRLSFAFAVTLLMFCGMSSQAQGCGYVAPYYFDAFRSCATNAGGLCSIGGPVTFEIQSWVSGVDRACATVEWNFQDGTIVSAPGSTPVVHAFATAGTYNVQAKIITTYNGYTSSDTEILSVQVGNGRVSVVSSKEVTEGSSAQFVIARTNVVGVSTVNWELRKSDNTLAQDVTPNAGSVTIPAGATSTTLTVSAADDAVFTNTRTHGLRLISATGGYTVPSGTAAHLTIHDDDNAVIDFAQSSISVPETIGLATIDLVRTGDLSRRNVVYYQVNGSGVIPVSGNAVFEIGTTLASFQFAVIDDTIREERTAQVIIETYEPGVKIGSFNRLTRQITLIDNEPPIVVQGIPQSVVEKNDGVEQVSFRIVLSEPAVDSFQLRAEIRPGTATAVRDYKTQYYYPWFHLPFNPGDTEKTITFYVVGDRDIERDETVLIDLSFWSWNNGGVVLPEDPLVFTILNDDAGLGPARLSVPRGGSESAFIDIGTPAPADMVIPLASADPGAVEVPASVTILAGQARAVFDVHGHTAGAWALITATFPAPMGEKTIKAEVYERAELVLDPAAVSLHPGQEVTVRASLDPPASETRTVGLQVVNGNIATAPQSVEIPAGGFGTFVVKGLVAGGTNIAATLPDQNGGGIKTLSVLVEASPDAPALNSIVPSTGPSAGGTAFEAYGAHLSADCIVRFGGVPATGVVLVNDGLLTGVTPAHAAGAVGVELQCGGQTSMLANGFTFLAARPTIATVVPSFGSAAGGTHVRVAGTNIRSECWLFLGGVASPAVETHGTTEITGVTPPRPNPGAVEVAIKCTDGTAALPGAFAYTNAAEPPASILSIAPMAGAPGESLTITGSRFRPGDGVTVDQTAATILESRPDTHVIRIPELPPGMSSITLTGAGGHVSTTGPIFAVLEPERPQIAAVSPQTTVAGAELVLTGRAFRPAYSFEAGAPAQVVDLAFDRVVLRLASDLAPGTYAIHLRNAAGQLAIVGPPVTIVEDGVAVRGVAPGCGSADGGTVVTITGSGFAPGAAVEFDGVAAASVEVIDPTRIRAVTPAGATGRARITVANTDGGEGSLTSGFRYRSPFDPAGCDSVPTRGRSVRH